MGTGLVHKLVIPMALNYFFCHLLITLNFHISSQTFLYVRQNSDSLAAYLTFNMLVFLGINEFYRLKNIGG